MIERIANYMYVYLKMEVVFSFDVYDEDVTFYIKSTFKTLVHWV